MLNREEVYPRLAVGAADEARVAIGHGLVAGFGTADGAEASPAEAGLEVEDARRIALENLARFADESPDLSVQVLGSPGGPIHLLLYADHPLASACLLLPDLHEHAAEMLHETDLLACVPQAESLVVFPAAIRDAVLAKLREIESDAARPLTFKLFTLSANGVVPFTPAR